MDRKLFQNAVENDLGAFRLRIQRSGSRAGDKPLSGLDFAAKDVIDIEGVTTGCGNPDWLASHQPAPQNAAVVDTLLQAGADLRGVTVADELTFSLSGENVHYGTPMNPAAPDCIPGGSSSGSAVAVAGAFVDFSLGTDTGGSVRVPASYCGIYGMRPSHGSIPLDGVMALSPSFDTIGWFARDARMLSRVGKVLFGRAEKIPERENLDLTRARILRDAFELAVPQAQPALDAALKRLKPAFDEMEELSLGDQHYADWLQSFNTLRSPEIWGVYGDWITRVKPRFGPRIARQFDVVRDRSNVDTKAALGFRRDAQSRLATLLRDDSVLILPTTPSPAPLKGRNDETAQRLRTATLTLSCIAPMGGVPQISFPAAAVEGKPMGVSIIGPVGSDLALLRTLLRLSGP